MAQLKNTTISDTGFLQLPAGTTAQRPSPAAGQMRLNSNSNLIEQYNGTEWKDNFNFPNVVATGGNNVENRNIHGVLYRVHTFTNVGSSIFSVTVPGEIEAFVWGAGGGGDTSYWRTPAGNGGAGGFSTARISVNVGDTFTIIVGGGGKVAPQSTYDANNTQEGGFGGGGWTKADGAGGGGLSGIFSSSDPITFDVNSQSRAILIAGGGGGGADGVAADIGVLDVGGRGGGQFGGTGATGQPGADGGTGGTQTQAGSNPRDSAGYTGSELQGAQAQTSVSTSGGAGGGGYYGGGSGYEISGPGGAGGGGSGFIQPGLSGKTLGGGANSTPPETNNIMYPGNNIAFGGSGNQDGRPGAVIIRYRI